MKNRILIQDLIIHLHQVNMRMNRIIEYEEEEEEKEEEIDDPIIQSGD